MRACGGRNPIATEGVFRRIVKAGRLKPAATSECWELLGDCRRRAANTSDAAYDADPIRILAVLDDTVISGKVKPVLALARHAREHRGASRPLELSMLTFVRSQDDPDFVRALRAEGFAIAQFIASEAVLPNQPYECARDRIQ